MPKKTTSKKSTRKITSETSQYRVRLGATKPTTGQTPQATKSITRQAPTPAAAVQQALMGDPQANNYRQVTVSKNAPGQPMQAITAPAPMNPTMQPTIKPMNQPVGAIGTHTLEGKKFKVDAETKKLIETITYPYAIMLPKQLGETLKPAWKKLLITMSEATGKVYAKVRDPESMRGLIESLSKQKRPEANLVLNGIKRYSR